VTVLPGKRYPDLINDDQKLIENSFTVPDAALADVPASLRGPAERPWADANFAPRSFRFALCKTCRARCLDLT
jgi:hypothetical protein